MNPQPVTRTSDSQPIGIVILAAGESARMGKAKQLLSYCGKTLLRHTAETALLRPGAPVVVVLGAHAEHVRPELAGLPVTIVENPDWSAGMGGSLRAGLGALLAGYPEAEAAIFLVCDQPLVSAETLETLVARHHESGRAIAASAYDGTLGVPALFDRSVFSELLGLQGSEGAKHLIQSHRDQVIGVPFPGGVVDIDTPGDYESLPIS